MKKIIVLMMALMLLLSFAGCSAADKAFDVFGGISDAIQSQFQPAFSYEEMIEDFVPTWNNCWNLKIGDVHKADGSIWLSDGRGTVYSSDESVVTVSKLGKVTAVGEGEAYVIITSGTLFKVTRYTITTG